MSWKSLILSVFMVLLGAPSFAQAGEITIDPEVRRSIKGFYFDVRQFFKLHSDNRALHGELRNHIFFDNGEFEINKMDSYSDEVIVRSLVRFIVWHAAASVDFDKTVIDKSWPWGEQNWKLNVQPFMNRHNNALTTSAKFAFRMSYAFRYLQLIFGDEVGASEEISRFYSQKEVDIIIKKLKPHFGNPSKAEAFFKNIDNFELDLVDVGGEDNWVLFDFKFPQPVFDSAGDCSKPDIDTEDPKEKRILKQQAIVETIFSARPVRKQIGNTCYANLAAEMVDIHRDVKFYKELGDNPAYMIPKENPVKINHKVNVEVLSKFTGLDPELMESLPGLDIADHYAIFSNRQGMTSAFYASAIFTARGESSSDGVRDFDYGWADKTVDFLLSEGGCPQSLWEMSVNNSSQSRDYYKTIHMLQYIEDPDNYRGSTPVDELLEDIRMVATFFGVSKTLAGEDTEVLDQIKADPKEFFKKMNVSPELLQQTAVYTAAMMTCVGAAFIRKEIEMKDLQEMTLERLKNFELPAGRKIEYPKGATDKIFGRHSRQHYNYSSMIYHIKNTVNSEQFRGIGLSACNGGLIENISMQKLIDLDRINGSRLHMYHGFNPHFAANKYGAKRLSQCLGHTYLLSDMRHNKPLRQCEYKLRNSWGKYKNYPTHLQESGWVEVTDDGKYDIWVPSHLLYRNMDKAFQIKPE